MIILPNIIIFALGILIKNLEDIRWPDIEYVLPYEGLQSVVGLTMRKANDDEELAG